MRKGEQTRRDIIRKAAPIFNQRGYEGAALSELMEATGLEKGGIYRHFDSKEQLAAEAFDYAWRETLDSRIHDLAGIPNAVDRLKQFVVNFVERRGVIPGDARCSTPRWTPMTATPCCGNTRGKPQ